MSQTAFHRRSRTSIVLEAVSVPALVGAGLGAIAALTLPLFDQGEVISTSAASSS